MVMRRAGGRVKLLLCTKRLELARLETSLVIAVEASHTRSSESNSAIVDRCTDERVELGHHSLSCLYDLGLVMEKLGEHNASEFVDEESGISELTGGRRGKWSLQVHVQFARLGGRSIH